MSPELLAIISHLELQNTPWWTEAVNSALLTTLFHSGATMSRAVLVSTMNALYSIGAEAVTESLDILESNFQILKADDGTYRLSPNTTEEVRLAITQWNSLGDDAKRVFVSILTTEVPEVDAERAWQVFQSDLLIPAIIDLGAQSWNFLVGGSADIPDSVEPYVRHYLSRYPAELWMPLRRALQEFMSPTREASRFFLADMLSAYFFFMASGLTITEVEHLKKLLANPMEIVAALDVDLLLALNGQMDAETNELAMSLLELANNVNPYAGLGFSIASITLSEARGAVDIAATMTSEEEIATSIVIEEPMASTVRGIVKGLISGGGGDPHAYFDAWAVSVDRRGLMDRIPSRPGLLEDERVQSEALTYKHMVTGSGGAIGQDQNGRRYVHDSALRVLVREARVIERAALHENRYWLVTASAPLLRFDALNSRRNGATPICVSPLTLLHMLRLWAPRSDVWDRAAIGALRLPLVLLGDTGKLDHAAFQVMRAMARQERRGMDDESGLAAVLSDHFRRTISSASGKVLSPTEVRGVSRSELEQVRLELDDTQNALREVREENATLSAAVADAQSGTERRRLALRMFGWAALLSLIVTVPVTLLLKENLQVFSSSLVASVVGASIGVVVTFVAARLYVAGRKDAQSLIWQVRLRQWLMSFFLLIVVNLSVAVLAAAVYDVGRGK